MRRLSIAAIGFALLACGTPPPINRTDGYSTATPAITGRSELISQSELQSALRSARIRLATLAPRSGIFRLIVVTTSRVEAYYWADYDRERVDVFYQNHARTGYLVLQRAAGEWRVLPGREPKTLNLDNAIITG
jgi:hypothetical protein